MLIIEALEKNGYKDMAAELSKDDEKRRLFVQVLDDMYLRGSEEQFISFFKEFWKIADEVYNDETLDIKY